MKNRLASSINQMNKFRSLGSSDTVATHDASGRFLVSTLDAFSELSIDKGNCNKKEKKSKFKQRRNGHDDNYGATNPNPSKKNRYHAEVEKLTDKSSFLDSILDRSSSIFRFKNKNTRELEDVRKKIDDKWNAKAAVLYDDEKEPTYMMFKPNTNFSQKGKTNNTSDDLDMVNIGHEISDFLNSDKSSFDFGIEQSLGASDNVPCFSRQMPNRKHVEAAETPLPSKPDMSFVSPSCNEEDKLNQIITISEIFQPSEDDLAERILSQKEEPFSINFDIDTGTFCINFDILPKDTRNCFISKTDFTCLQLNDDVTVKIKQNQKIKILSSDGCDNLFGYIIDPKLTKEPLLIPLERVEPVLSEFPLSAQRHYYIKSWQEIGRNLNQTRAQEKKEEFNKGATWSHKKSEKVKILECATPLNAGEEAKVYSVESFKMDFNNHPLSLSFTRELKAEFDNLHVLSGNHGDMICVTTPANEQGWIEGYLIKDPERTLGLVHSKFIA